VGGKCHSDIVRLAQGDRTSGAVRYQLRRRCASLLWSLRLPSR
jgi:hypothetical protein